MAYWGPPKGDLSGQLSSGNIRIQHEILTADLRKIYQNEISVFATYKIISQSPEGIIRFVFVASAQTGAAPEFILDNRVIPAAEKRFRMIPWNAISNNSTADTFIEFLQIQKSNSASTHLHLQETLFIYELMLTPGKHDLKVGYHCNPVIYEDDLLRYTAFPYFLGNEKTRHSYDSIFLQLYLPDSVNYKCNFDLTKSGEFYTSHNIAGSKDNHLLVSLFRDVRKEIHEGRKNVKLKSIFFLVILQILIMILIHWWLKKGRKMAYLFIPVLPVAILVTAVFLGLWTEYYREYNLKYRPFIHGDFGKGYWAIGMMLFTFILTSIAYTAIVFVYGTIVKNKKYDLLHYISKRKLKE